MPDIKNDNTPRIVACPTCQTAVKWTPQNDFRPFCSERCKLIDLGSWADESHVIEGDDQDINSEDIF
ncbi:MAG: endogenous inhibitor of DNA gyrase (YacG/DUF329 family) [Candidatus Azotimanducaceae bacterium]|jgi:endogenous inhibitor of DNA gyrase (YacG/DUF329 family)